MAGMELLFATAQSKIKNSGDAIVCAIHWNLVSNNFKCIGVGDEVPTSLQGARRSEMLPGSWSADPDSYGLLYWPNDSTDTHLLKVIRMDGTLLVHLMRSSDNKVVDSSINIADYTSNDISSFDSAYTNIDGLNKKLTADIIKPLSKKAPTQTSTQGESSRRAQEERQERERQDPDYDPLRVGPRRGGRPVPGWADPNNPLAVGRGDLDPLAGGMGGGMLMDPRGFPGIGRGRDPNAGLPGRLPPGAVPPGARFDPFGPPVPDPSANPHGGPRAGPDPDHLPPPGFDDMFM